jgi:hypothetical protein
MANGCGAILSAGHSARHPVSGGTIEVSLTALLLLAWSRATSSRCAARSCSTSAKGATGGQKLTSLVARIHLAQSQCGLYAEPNQIWSSQRRTVLSISSVL